MFLGNPAQDFRGFSRRAHLCGPGYPLILLGRRLPARASPSAASLRGNRCYPYCRNLCNIYNFSFSNRKGIPFAALRIIKKINYGFRKKYPAEGRYRRSSSHCCVNHLLLYHHCDVPGSFSGHEYGNCGAGH